MNDLTIEEPINSHFTFFSSVSLFCTLFSFPFCVLGGSKNSLWLKVPQSKYDPS